MTTNKQLQDIVEKCLSKQINPLEAVNQIDNAIGIQGVRYKSGKGFKVYSENKTYAIQTTGYRKKEAMMIPIIAVLSYELAKKKGMMLPGEVHISREASTKHHMKGIDEIVKKYTA